jgi:hypothetical protein
MYRSVQMITICKSLMRKITIRILCVRGFRVPSEARQFLNDEGTQWVSNMFQFLPHILGTHSGCPKSRSSLGPFFDPQTVHPVLVTRLPMTMSQTPSTSGNLSSTSQQCGSCFVLSSRSSYSSSSISVIIIGVN